MDRKKTPKETIEQLENAVRDECSVFNTNSTFFLVEALNTADKLEYNVFSFYINDQGHLFGTSGNMFHFDYYDVRQITNWWPLREVLNKIKE